MSSVVPRKCVRVDTMRFSLVLSALLALLMSRATITSAQKCDCPSDFSPVCGRDLRTYPNECTLGCAKQRKAYNGHCKKRGNFY
ncbi:hypothetical protein B5X24_HaOG216487 [Helicoverpa armigera]|nr:hypothetical protein B5X24_HaOG216487 [Helicoverpa armigera]